MRTLNALCVRFDGVEEERFCVIKECILYESMCHLVDKAIPQ